MVTQDTCGFMVFCEPQKIRPWSRGTGERRTSYNPERVLYLNDSLLSLTHDSTASYLALSCRYGNVIEIFGYKRAGGRVISKNRCVKRYVIKVIYNIARPSESGRGRRPYYRILRL